MLKTFPPAWIFIALLNAWMPAFAPTEITNTHSSTTPSASTSDLPDVSTSSSTDDGIPNGPEYGTMLYNLSLGPLQCSAAWPYLHRRDMGVCKQLWPPGEPLPQVRCDAVGGYRQVAETFTTLIHGIGMYQLMGSAVFDAAGTSRWRGWCLTQTSYEMRKADSLPPGVPVAEDFVLVKSINNSQEHDGDGKDFILAIVSQGLRRYRVEFDPMVLGAYGALVADKDCPLCPAEMWHIDLLWTPDTLNLYLNLAKGILMEFHPAFAPLASSILRSLKEFSRVEEVDVHGGDRWNDRVVVVAELRSLRRVDFSGSGLAALSDENFPRMPNLVHLDLSHNRFSSVPMGIRSLRRLRTLNVSHNPFETMKFAPVLRSLQQLEVLNVSGIPLKSLDTLVLDEGVENIPNNGTMVGDMWRVLDASSCNLSEVNSTATRVLFRRLRNLHVLILADNPLSAVPHDFLVDMHELQVLDLSGCLLTQPPALRLAAGVRLQRLDLSRNLLSSPAGALAQVQGGEGVEGGGAALLDVSGNPLRGEWGAHAFAALGPRAAVNLSRTELTALTPPMLRALRSLRLVDLGANPIDCAKCDIRHLQEWLNSTSLEVVSLGRRGPLQCGLPPESRGRAVGEAYDAALAQCAGRTAEGSGAVWAAGAAVGVALAVGAAAMLLALRFRMLISYAVHVVRANRAMRAGAGGSGCEFDAFVCYSKHDRPWVMGKLLPCLEGSNPRYHLCLHERDFPLGSLIVQNIVECMARSRRTIMILTPAFVGSQWCQWELEMATHRLLEGAGRDFLVLVELQPLDARALPRLLRLLVETRTFLQWPSGCAPGGCCGGGAEGAEEAAWRRLRAALGPPIKRSSRHGLPAQSSAVTLALPSVPSLARAPVYLPPTDSADDTPPPAIVKLKDSFLSEADIQLSTMT